MSEHEFGPLFQWEAIDGALRPDAYAARCEGCGASFQVRIADDGAVRAGFIAPWGGTMSDPWLTHDECLKAEAFVDPSGHFMGYREPEESNA